MRMNVDRKNGRVIEVLAGVLMGVIALFSGS
jgi:hypothetical protein